MATIQTVQVDNNGGGINDHENPINIGPSECLNTSYNTRGEADSFKPRPGYITYGVDYAPGSVSAMGEYIRNESVDDRLVRVTSDNKIWFNDTATDSTFTEVIQSFLTSPEVNMDSAYDWLFLFNGVDKPLRVQPSVTDSGTLTTGLATVTGLDTTILLAGTPVSGTGIQAGTAILSIDSPTEITLSLPATATGAQDLTFTLPYVDQPFTQPDSISSAADFTPLTGAYFLGSLFVGGVPTSPGTLFISKSGTSGNPEYIYDFSGNTQGLGDSNEILMNSPIVAIQEVSGALVAFTTTGGLYIPNFIIDTNGKVNWDRAPIASCDGAVSQKSTTVVENDVYYLTPQKELKSIRRDQSGQISVFTVPLSIKVQNFLNTYIDDDLSSAWGAYDPIKKLYTLHLRPKGNVGNYVVLVGDLTRLDQMGVPAWSLDTGKAFQSGVFHKKYLYTGSTASGQVFIDEEGFADDDNAAIETQRVSKKFTAGNPKNVKKFRSVRVYGEMTPSTNIVYDVYVDDTFVKTQTITNDDFLSPTAGSGGIGSQRIASFPIGAEVEDPDPLTQRFTFQSTATLRASGRTIQVVFKTDNTNQDYRIPYWEYGFIGTRGIFYPRKEK